MEGMRVWSLVGELRSHIPRGPKNQNIKQKQYCNKFDKGFKNGPQKNLKKNTVFPYAFPEVLHLCFPAQIIDLYFTPGIYPHSSTETKARTFQ